MRHWIDRLIMLGFVGAFFGIFLAIQIPMANDSTRLGAMLRDEYVRTGWPDTWLWWLVFSVSVGYCVGALLYWTHHD